jgi:hypothetical protein
MTQSDVRAHAAELAAAGVDVQTAMATAVGSREATIVRSHGTALYWLFFTESQPGWEVMRTAVVQLAW